MTLTELLVASVMMVTLSAVLWSTTHFQSRMQSGGTAQNVTQRTLRLWAHRMANDVRNAGYRPRDDAPEVGILEAGASVVRFTLDAVEPFGTHDAGDSRENVGYRIADAGADGFGRLERWLGGDRWRRLLEPVRLELRYRNNQGVELGGAGPIPMSRSAIRRVEITLSARSAGAVAEGAPAPVTSVSTGASLRNALLR